MIVIVGPSGVGKDSLINHAAAGFAGHPRFAVVRRVVTRPSDNASEVHDTMTPAAFAAARAAGRFAVSWSAHGLDYGIPDAHRAFIAAGGVALCNGSRRALDAFSDAFVHLTVVNVTARTDILKARLAGRGRESDAEISARLARASMAVRGDYDVRTIDNSSTLALAGNRLIAIIGDALATG